MVIPPKKPRSSAVGVGGGSRSIASSSGTGRPSAGGGRHQHATATGSAVASSPAVGTLDHPPVWVMVKAAIMNLKERKGSSRQAILKYIVSNYKVETSTKFKALMKRCVAKAITDGKLVKTKGSFKLSGEEKVAKKHPHLQHSSSSKLNSHDRRNRQQSTSKKPKSLRPLPKSLNKQPKSITSNNSSKSKQPTSSRKTKISSHGAGASTGAHGQQPSFRSMTSQAIGISTSSSTSVSHQQHNHTPGGAKKVKKSTIKTAKAATKKHKLVNRK